VHRGNNRSNAPVFLPRFRFADCDGRMTTDFKQAEITRKISEISRIMSDGFLLVQMRFMLEQFEQMPDDPAAQELLEMVNRFYRLCKHVEEK